MELLDQPYIAGADFEKTCRKHEWKKQNATTTQLKQRHLIQCPLGNKTTRASAEVKAMPLHRHQTPTLGPGPQAVVERDHR
jgi:hypothetical protein